MKTINVVAAITIKDHKIFATQRGYGEFKNGWEFPGGKIETGETPQQALKREIREELDAADQLVLKEHEAAKWLTRDNLDSVAWLPADVTIIEKLKNLDF